MPPCRESGSFREYNGIGVVSNLAVRNEVIGPHKIEIIDLAPWDKFININRPGGFERAMLSSSSLLTSRYRSVSGRFHCVGLPSNHRESSPRLVEGLLRIHGH